MAGRSGWTALAGTVIRWMLWCWSVSGPFHGRELWEHVGAPAGTSPLLPLPHFNVVNAGAHAVNKQAA
ncbi:hypothetical protein ACFRMN_09480 [Streptomyces sp. NPDC056835]|uniref:hypothetical protein n=1 Tax=Streptomyces sp. NPDC056835 TaxID=3345956 RepID=UPI0036BD99A5